MKDNFLLKKSQQEVFRELSDVDAGKLIKGIFNYVNTGDSELDGYLKIVFIPIKDYIDKNEERYQKRCEKNKENIKKRWEKKQKDTNEYERIPTTYEPIPNDTDNNHISYITNHLEEKKDNRGMGEEEKKETFNEKIHFAEFVTMTNAEYKKLVSTYGKKFADQCIKTLDNYKGSTGKKYRSDYRAILSWVVDKVKKDVSKETIPQWFDKNLDVEKVEDNSNELNKILDELGGNCEKSQN